MKSEAKGYEDGLASGLRVPREPDYFDAVHACNAGGPNYQRGFIDGVTAAHDLTVTARTEHQTKIKGDDNA